MVDTTVATLASYGDAQSRPIAFQFSFASKLDTSHAIDSLSITYMSCALEAPL